MKNKSQTGLRKISSARGTRFLFIILSALILGTGALVLFVVVGYSSSFQSLQDFFSHQYEQVAAGATGLDSDGDAGNVASSQPAPLYPALNIADYNQKLLQNANIPNFASTTLKIRTIVGSSTLISTTTLASTFSYTSTTTISSPDSLWPVKTVYPANSAALLPFNRIVAYYGNFYSTGMGVLGKYPPPQMLQMLQSAVAQWQDADPSTPVIPALDYIAVAAQGSPQANDTYTTRMPASQIQEAVQLASQVNGIVILDVQVGDSNLQTEIPLLEPFLKLPQVELAIDPEFSMHDGAKPGSEIGSFDASDINYAADYLAGLVRQYNLPPKILVVHRFTQDMVTNYQQITPLPEVQIVMDMDGWGPAPDKLATYQDFIYDEPVQFTGFKLFYVNDSLAPGSAMMTPEQILKLSPQPLFIQYQ